MVILQKIGKATPSVAATLIEQLPDEDDPQRPVEEKIAQNVAALTYIGLWSCKWTVNLGWSTNYLMSLPSGGADTVSERNKNIMNKFIKASLDSVSRTVPQAIPCHGNISGGPEKSTSRNRCCGGRTSSPRF